MNHAQPEIIEGDEDIDLPPARPAATLLVFADGVGANPPAVLMVKRSEQMVFAGGAVVFPGGRVDPDDVLIAHQLAKAGDDHEDFAGRVAAIRETVEETGLLIGASGPYAPELAAALRQGLSEGAAFSELLDREGVELDVAALTYFSRWIPKLNNPRRFDTRFYIARTPIAPADAGLTVDDTENSALFWASAAQTLVRADQGDLAIIFPTRRNLERIAQYGSFAEALSCAARHPATIISPWIERRGEERFLVIPSGIGYPITEERLTTASRG